MIINEDHKELQFKVNRQHQSIYTRSHICKKECRNCAVPAIITTSRASCRDATRCSLRARNSNRLLLQLTTRSSLAFQFLYSYFLANREKEKAAAIPSATPSSDSQHDRPPRDVEIIAGSRIYITNAKSSWPRSILVSTPVFSFCIFHFNK